MTGTRGNAGRTRVKTARNRTPQSTRWLARQLNDPMSNVPRPRAIAAVPPIS